MRLSGHGRRGDALSAGARAAVCKLQPHASRVGSQGKPAGAGSGETYDGMSVGESCAYASPAGEPSPDLDRIRCTAGDKTLSRGGLACTEGT